MLSISEVRRILEQCPEGSQIRLMAELYYGTGMRLLEVCRLRIKDVDFERHQIMVREGKGEKDRMVPLPVRCEAALRKQMESALRLHRDDVSLGFGDVWLPYAIAEKYPAASREPGWQYVFPAKSRSVDPRGGAPSSGLAGTFSPEAGEKGKRIAEAPSSALEIGRAHV